MMNGTEQQWIEHVARSVTETLEAAPDSERGDIVAVQLDIYAEDDDEDLRRLVAAIAWNTQRNLDARQRVARNDEDREYEACSRFAWSRREARTVGADEQGAALRRAFLEERDLWPEDDDVEIGDTDLGMAVIKAMVESVRDAVRTLQRNGSIEAIIGREAPVFIASQLSSPQMLSTINRAANPARFHSLLDRWTIAGR